MIVKELITILQSLPQEAYLNFHLGETERERDLIAKTQLRCGDTMLLTRLVKVEYTLHTPDGECEDDGMVELTLADDNYEHYEMKDAEKEFDALAEGIIFNKYKKVH